MRLIHSAFGLSALISSTSAVTIEFWAGYNCQGSSIGCANVGSDYCCPQSSGAFAFAGSIQGLSPGSVGTVYVGNPLGVCNRPRFVGGNICQSAVSGGAGIAGASYHVYGPDNPNYNKRTDNQKCKGNATINHIATQDGAGAWELEKGAFADDEFTKILENFRGLDQVAHKSFLQAHGAVYNDQVVTPKDIVIMKVSVQS